MPDFLRICQDVARESGTIPGEGYPTAVTGQTGRLNRVVNWVADAWKKIQTERKDWRWMQAEFSGTLISGTQRYDAAAMGISSRFDHWRLENFSIYKTVSDETPINYLEWEQFYPRYMVGEQPANARPNVFSVDQNDKLVFSPTPDDAYVVRGFYQKAPQILAADTDTPEMPEAFHDLIRLEALILMATFDEAVTQEPRWRLDASHIRTRLESRQLPKFKLAGPLA